MSIKSTTWIITTINDRKEKATGITTWKTCNNNHHIRQVSRTGWNTIATGKYGFRKRIPTNHDNRFIFISLKDTKNIQDYLAVFIKPFKTRLNIKVYRNQGYRVGNMKKEKGTYK